MVVVIEYYFDGPEYITYDSCLVLDIATNDLGGIMVSVGPLSEFI